MPRRQGSDPPSDDTPTPNTSSSFAFFHEAAKALAHKLELVAVLKRRTLAALDLAGARECDVLAMELREMADRFAAWPEHPERVAEERPVLAPRLMKLTHVTAEMTESLPEEARARLPRE